MSRLPSICFNLKAIQDRQAVGYFAYRPWSGEPDQGHYALALKVQQGLGRDQYGGEIFCFRGRKGDLIKILWHDGVGMSLNLKRVEAGSSSGR